MAYLGRQPNTGVRSRYIYTATASQTTFSGSDDDGKTLKYEDAAYLDVFLNGVLLKPVTDYTATSKTSVVLTSAAAASDIVEIVAYDIANIADTVSKANGGTFDAGVTVNGTVTSDGLTVDTDTLYVDSTNNNVGIGTSSPTGSGRILHLNGSSTVADFHMTNSTSGSTSTDGFVLRYSGLNAEFLNREAGNIVFYTNGTERLKIEDDGDILAGRIYSNTTSGGANVRVQSNGLLQRDTSSQRYKNTINDATHGLAEVLALRPVTYKGNNDGDTVFGGLIAEEVHDAGLTEFVEYDHEDRPDALRYANMVSLCVKAIQELNTKVETLEAENVTIKARLDALENA